MYLIQQTPIVRFAIRLWQWCKMRYERFIADDNVAIALFGLILTWSALKWWSHRLEHRIEHHKAATLAKSHSDQLDSSLVRQKPYVDSLLHYQDIFGDNNAITPFATASSLSPWLHLIESSDSNDDYEEETAAATAAVEAEAEADEDMFDLVSVINHSTQPFSPIILQHTHEEQLHHPVAIPMQCRSVLQDDAISNTPLIVRHRRRYHGATTQNQQATKISDMSSFDHNTDQKDDHSMITTSPIVSIQGDDEAAVGRRRGTDQSFDQYSNPAKISPAPSAESLTLTSSNNSSSCSQEGVGLLPLQASLHGSQDIISDQQCGYLSRQQHVIRKRTCSTFAYGILQFLHWWENDSPTADGARIPYPQQQSDEKQQQEQQRRQQQALTKRVQSPIDNSCLLLNQSRGPVFYESGGGSGEVTPRRVFDQITALEGIANDHKSDRESVGNDFSMLQSNHETLSHDTLSYHSSDESSTVVYSDLDSSGSTDNSVQNGMVADAEKTFQKKDHRDDIQLSQGHQSISSPSQWSQHVGDETTRLKATPSSSAWRLEAAKESSLPNNPNKTNTNQAKNDSVVFQRSQTHPLPHVDEQKLYSMRNNVENGINNKNDHRPVIFQHEMKTDETITQDTVKSDHIPDSIDQRRHNDSITDIHNSSGSSSSNVPKENGQNLQIEPSQMKLDSQPHEVHETIHDNSTLFAIPRAKRDVLHQSISSPNIERSSTTKRNVDTRFPHHEMHHISKSTSAKSLLDHSMQFEEEKKMS